MNEIKPTIGEDGWESKDVYLQKEGESGFVGLHATGMMGEDDKWHAIEAWVNSYSDTKKYQGSVARLFGPIEETVEEMLRDGYQVVSNWEIK